MSAPLQLDYAPPRGLQRRSRALLFGGLLLLAGLVARHADVVDAQARLRQAVPPPVAAGGGKVSAGRDAAGPPGAIDWSGILPVLEAAADTGVRLVALNAAGDGAQIEGQAGDPLVAVDYADRLQRLPFFADVVIEHTERMPETAPPQFRFSLAVRRTADGQ